MDKHFSELALQGHQMTCRSTAQFPELKEMKDMQEQLSELVKRLSLPQANEDTTKNTIAVLQGLLRTLNRAIQVTEFNTGLNVDTTADSGLSSSAHVSKDDKKR